MTADRDELLACPFCAAGEWVESSDAYCNRLFVHVSKGCALHAHVVRDIAAWNTRAVPQRPEGAAVAKDDIWTGSLDTRPIVKSPPASAVAEHGEPMSDGQIAYERAFPDRTNRVPFKLLPNWMEHQWHRQAERDKTAQAATVSDVPRPMKCWQTGTTECAYDRAHRFMGDPRSSFSMSGGDTASSPAAPAPVIPESEKGQ